MLAIRIVAVPSTIQGTGGDTLLLQELAEKSGTSAASIKFYRREGLLPPGRRVTATRQEYDEQHLSRLQLIQTLRELVDAPISRIREITEALDDPDRSLTDALATAQALILTALGIDSPATGAEHPSVPGLLAAMNWPDVPSRSRQALSDVLHQLDSVGAASGHDVLVRFARAMEDIAVSDLASMRAPQDSAAAPSDDLIVIRAVVGTIAYDRLISALRMLAHASLTVRGDKPPARDPHESGRL